MLSSVGSERLPYKEEVTGPNPVVSTNKKKQARVAQLTERGPSKSQVAGLNPVSRSNFKG